MINNKLNRTCELINYRNSCWFAFCLKIVFIIKCVVCSERRCLQRPTSSSSSSETAGWQVDQEHVHHPTAGLTFKRGEEPSIIQNVFCPERQTAPGRSAEPLTWRSRGISGRRGGPTSVRYVDSTPAAGVLIPRRGWGFLRLFITLCLF